MKNIIKRWFYKNILRRDFCYFTDGVGWYCEIFKDRQITITLPLHARKENRTIKYRQIADKK